MRSLASIQRITAIDPIPNADAIEVASVLGWDVVVKKGEYKAGDLAVYLEIDSIPPDEEQYRFLWKFAEHRPNNFRIKTIKLRGQISQGILFPLSVVAGRDVWEGRDVTEFLSITKYEAPLPRGSDDIAGQFFDGVPKTDEERVQSAKGARHLADLRGRPYYITVKCDGSSMTVAYKDNGDSTSGVKVASRNYRLAENPDSVYYRAAYAGEAIDLVVDQPWLALQGELVGPGIQNNRLGYGKPTFLVFNMFDRREGRYLSLSEMLVIARVWDIQLVPVLTVGHLFNESQESLLAMAEGKYEGTKNEREGIVIRSNDAGPSVSFKAISNRFLLGGGE